MLMQSYALYSASHIVLIPEAYLKAFETSMMELFCENSERLKAWLTGMVLVHFWYLFFQTFLESFDILWLYKRLLSTIFVFIHKENNN